MIELSRFRAAVLQEGLIKVAHVTPDEALEIQRTGVLHVDPGFLGSGCIMEDENYEYVLKVVGSYVDNVLSQDYMRRARAYRWLFNKLSDHSFNDESTDERFNILLAHRYNEGDYPDVHVLTLESVTEQIFEDDVSTDPPQGEYQPHKFVTILNYPIYNKQSEYVKDEYIALVTDI